jgi:hypothetical protein
MNKPQLINSITAHDFSGNPGAVITKKNTYTFNQYQPSHTAWLRHSDNVRGSLKINYTREGAFSTFSPAHFAE